MAAEIHFRRMIWMMIFGIIHWTLLLWFGEILFAFSMCGMVLFAVRNMAPRLQLGIAGALLLVATVLSWQAYSDTVAAERKAATAEAAQAGGAALSEEQQAAIDEWQNHVGAHTPSPEFAEQVRDWHNGGYWNAVTGQLDFSYEFQWTTAPFWLVFDMIPFMLLGMALLKLGVLGAGLPSKVYGAMLVVGYGIGVPLGGYELSLLLGSGFATASFSQADVTYEVSRLAMVVGHLGLALLWIKHGGSGILHRALAACGQMALSNYLAQTLICTALFYGFGFGLFGALARHQLYYVVAAIWIAQLIWSPIWLANFRFGPFEWLWRSLTYWKPQPMRIARTAPVVPPGAAPA